jgi:hypothetical protein
MNASIIGFDEERILGEVTSMSVALMESFKFQIRYASVVSDKQEKKTAKFLKAYRAEHWKKALQKAKGNKQLAYRFYIEDL